MRRRVMGMDGMLAARERMPNEALDELAVKARADKDAREAVTVECMGLIAHCSRRVRNMLGEDAFGEATVIFLESIETFDSDIGNFRAWALFNMVTRLSNLARTEVRYRARILRGEEELKVSDPRPMPELLVTSVREGALTNRQALIVQMRADGFERETILTALSIGRRTYEGELKTAMKALRSYL